MFRHPTRAELRQAATRLGMQPDDAYLDTTGRILRELSSAYEHLDTLPDDPPRPRYPRSGGTRPSPDENRHGGWCVTTSIRGAASGPLAGRRVALKDNICVAGVPMTNGADVFEDYVPDTDATVVTRILDAGGEIAGKTVCEYYCVSGGSHTASSGLVHNPRKYGYSAGGSSSGSAAVVAAGDVDLALGCDQAGSVRIPSSYCGIYGMKPTFGRVPYTGIGSLEPTLDHCGPMTATVADNALLLQVIAGPDGLDSRQPDIPVGDFSVGIGKSIAGLKIGVVREAFARPNSERDVDTRVRAGAAQFAKLGASVEDVSVPMHHSGFPIWAAIAHEGGLYTMLETNGIGTGTRGLYVESFRRKAAGWRDNPDRLAHTIKIMALFGRDALDRYGGAYYAKAMNLRRSLRAAYDAALVRYDLLLMPTLPLKATKFPPDDAAVEEIVARSWEMIGNTCPFDVTGHPAMTLPCGTSSGLPIGLMLIGKHFDETTIYRAAAAFEADGFGRIA
jgi:amidase